MKILTVKLYFARLFRILLFKVGLIGYSAKLCGRKKQDAADSCCLYVLFRPCGNEGILKNMEIEIIPDEYTTNKAIYKHGDNKKSFCPFIHLKSA